MLMRPHLAIRLLAIALTFACPAFAEDAGADADTEASVGDDAAADAEEDSASQDDAAEQDAEEEASEEDAEEEASEDEDGGEEESAPVKPESEQQLGSSACSVSPAAQVASGDWLIAATLGAMLVRRSRRRAPRPER
jgi:hypothetical protein